MDQERARKSLPDFLVWFLGWYLYLLVFIALVTEIFRRDPAVFLLTVNSDSHWEHVVFRSQAPW